ncbi:MAG TPA: ABC transporter permease [Thermoflexales bacterium]|nr:ABC transporter permease [Thermoflexales bacterium]HQW33835.1 ABC transporter permease [Thermoflexales bacterium]HQX75915.1 ABC transporter permease [Thermoflexales bacterium]HQZ21477.1 ABC transporter permease [Thermoflexales bacterium]HRA00582.1 ABC transporter permease [Thermoflexales bacterium]
MAIKAADALSSAKAQANPYKAEGQWTIVFRRFRKHRLAMISSFLIVFFLLMALMVPLIAPFERDAINADMRYSPLMTPDTVDGRIHILGTDHLGRDFFTRLLYGARVSLTIALLVSSGSALIGMTIGSVAGFYRGIVDTILMRVLEFMATVPDFPILLVLAAVLNSDPKLLPIPPFVASLVSNLMLINSKEARSVIVVVFVLTLFGWTGMARLMRGMVLSIREQDFISAVRSLGANDLRLILRHVIPNSLPPIIVAFTLSLAGALVSETALSFLGLGVTDPTPTWGNMLDFTARNILVAPWATLIPGIPVVLCSLAFNFIGDGLRDALDPRLKK